MFLLGIAFAIVLRASTSTFSYISINTGNPPSADEMILLPEFYFEDEAYINDIPFNTECIVKNCIYRKAIAVIYDFEEEAYVEDIPFNTEIVTAENNFETALKIDFEMDDEAYIDDIPFDTYSIANKSVQSHYAFVK